MFEDDPRAWEEAQRAEDQAIQSRDKYRKEIERLLSDPTYAQKVYKDMIIDKERNRIWNETIKHIDEISLPLMEVIIFGGMD